MLRWDLLDVVWKLLEHSPVDEAPCFFLKPPKNGLDGIVRGRIPHVLRGLGEPDRKLSH